ncbi:MAG: hypothetical protein EOP81_14800 [Variovorax sp.]|nr:MAG: hypothetical protein EOP81_14800 [Variovorax sp.]
MTKPFARIARWLAVPLVLPVVCVGALLWWLPSDEEIARRIESAFERGTGVALQVGEVHWALRPTPVVVLTGVTTMQPTPITLRRIAVHPQLRALFDRRIAIDLIEIDGAVVPRAATPAFRDGSAEKADPGEGWVLADIPVRTLRFTDVTWIDRREIALAYDGHAVFDAGWVPREAEVQRRGVTPMARLRLVREGTDAAGTAESAPVAAGADNARVHRWRTLIDVGGGTWNGTTQLQALADGGYRLQGELAAADIDLVSMVSAFQRRSAVTGKVSGQTTLRAEGADMARLVRSLHTSTRFTVKPATLLRFDLQKAVATAGLERNGQTPLDTLTGTLDTQNTGDGMALRYTGLKARSGLLTASGNASVYQRRIEGDVAVDLVDGVVGVPLKIGGTLDAPQLSLTGGALAGAAIGSAVAPGIGTVIGARIGQQVERIFGGGEAPAKAPPGNKR